MRYFGQRTEDRGQRAKKQRAKSKGQKAKSKRTKDKGQKNKRTKNKEQKDIKQAWGVVFKKIRSEGIGANTSTKRDKLEKNVIHYSLQFRSLFIITITFYSLLQHFLFIITTENHLFFSCNYTIL